MLIFMKILIVDDEELTREGLVQSIDWTSLKIFDIVQADDGLNGYFSAMQNVPDIILTDVRMPRMNGIEMSERIQQMNPDCSIIFMSGYSDKEYLKAAIKLKAVWYVEKPIDHFEVTEAIKEAVSIISQKKMHKQSLDFIHKEASSRLAVNLTKADFQLESDDFSSLESLKEAIIGSTYFTTIILKVYDSLSHFTENELPSLLQSIDILIGKYGMKQVHTLKYDAFLVLHIFGNERHTHTLLKRLCRDIHLLFDPQKHFFIVAGKPVSDFRRVYRSYNSAVILLQNTFFYEYGSILIYETTPSKNFHIPIAQINDSFVQFLSEKKVEEARKVMEKFYGLLLHNRSLLPNQVKDIYYKFFTQINSSIYHMKLSLSPNHIDAESLLELVADCNTISDLQQLLMEKLSEFEHLLSEAKPENTTVFLIRDYISQNYMNVSLSIKDISEHVNLSFSYICTIFKTETGQTMNQYITEFRLEKAKQLLRDPRNKITEISAKVGYADGNYFSKSFKKEVGLSPSDFREKELS